MNPNTISRLKEDFLYRFWLSFVFLSLYLGFLIYSPVVSTMSKFISFAYGLYFCFMFLFFYSISLYMAFGAIVVDLTSGRMNFTNSKAELAGLALSSFSILPYALMYGAWSLFFQDAFLSKIVYFSQVTLAIFCFCLFLYFQFPTVITRLAHLAETAVRLRGPSVVNQFEVKEYKPVAATSVAEQPKSERAVEKEQRISEWNARKPKLTFDDVFGMGEFKAKLQSTYNRFLTEGGNGILLTGDPGNGKTFMAEAFAGDLGMNFMEVRTNEITSKWVGEGPRNIAEIFEAARRQAPCIIFLDEFDSLMTSRDRHPVGDHLQMANTVLTELAALNRGFAKHQVLVLAASNFRDKLDGAGIREGRFDVKLEVPPPDNQARHHLMLQVLANVPFVADDVQRMADRLEGYSVTRVMAMSKQAAYNAKKESIKVDFDLLKKCLREVQGTSGEIMSEKMKTLDDLCLTDNLRKSLDDLVSMMKEPEKIEASGGSLPKGLIFYGPPGTGKTVTAQALAHASGWGFISTNSQDLLANVNKIDDIVKKAKEIRPVVVFIDEADGALADRARNPHSRDITAKILAVMDGPKALRDVIFVAATNFPDDIDSAMTRWGRFSEKFDFKSDDKVRLSLISRIIKSKKHIEWKGDMSQFAANMNNTSPADIEGFLLRAISKAALNAPHGSKPVIDLDNAQANSKV